MRNIFQLSPPIRMVEGKHGFMIYNQYCHWVGKALELYGEYCEHEIELFSRIIKNTDVVWEIGANTGSQSVPLARMVPNGTFVAFEPQIELCKIMTSNLSVNGMQNSRTFNVALSDKNNTIRLPSVDYNKANNFGGVTLLSDDNRSIAEVECRTIDSFKYLPKPNFLKIDVEGMELIVLRGGAETIKESKPVIYCENDRPEHSESLIDYFWKIGYECYWHITSYFNQKNHFNYSINIYGNTYSFNMLCIPKSINTRVSGMKRIEDKTLHPIKKRV